MPFRALYAAMETGVYLREKAMTKMPDKNKRAALLLCLFLGGFAAHRFYAGKVATALLMLALSPFVFGLASFVLALALPDAVPAAQAAGGHVGRWLTPAWFIWWAYDLVSIYKGKFAGGALWKKD